MSHHHFAFPEPEDPGHKNVWYGRIIRLMVLVCPLEPGDVQWREIERDIGGCTWAYVNKDESAWHLHVARIRLKVDGGLKQRIELVPPVWC